MNDTPIGWRVQLVTGATLATMACAAAAVDLINNYAYGISISPMMSAVMVLAAAGVIALPTAASVLGWSWHMRAATALCVALTIWAAHMAYSSSQDATVVSSQTASENYTKAKEKETRAREVLSKVKEVGSQEELGNLASKADTKLAEADAASKKDCKRSYTDACTDAKAAKSRAEAAAMLAHERLSQAKARDKAEADLAEAEGRSASGPAQKREESQVLTWLGIALTQLVALLGGHAASLIAGALRTRPAQTPKAKRAAAPVNPTGGTQQPLPANVVPLDAHRHSVKAWADGATAPGGDLKGGEALKAYKRWAGRMAADMTAGELRSILAAIYPGAVETRTSGYVVRGISLRTAAASQKRAAVC